MPLPENPYQAPRAPGLVASRRARFGPWLSLLAASATLGILLALALDFLLVCWPQLYTWRPWWAPLVIWLPIVCPLVLGVVYLLDRWLGP